MEVAIVLLMLVGGLLFFLAGEKGWHVSRSWLFAYIVGCYGFFTVLLTRSVIDGRIAPLIAVGIGLLLAPGYQRYFNKN